MFMHCRKHMFIHRIRHQSLLNYSKVETHDWCGLIHFHTFKSSILPHNQPGWVVSAVQSLAWLWPYMSGFSGTRVSLFYIWGIGAGGSGDSTPVFASSPIIENHVLFWAWSTKWLSQEVLRVRNSGSQFVVGGKSEGLWISPAGCVYTRDHMRLTDREIETWESTACSSEI